MDLQLQCNQCGIQVAVLVDSGPSTVDDVPRWNNNLMHLLSEFDAPHAFDLNNWQLAYAIL